MTSSDHIKLDLHYFLKILMFRCSRYSLIFKFKKVLWLYFLVIFSTLANSQTLVNVKSYGAVGDGKKDDTKAFLDAVKKVNELKKNVTLLIPRGNYVIKPQAQNNDPNAPPYAALNILTFSDCDNIKIQGENGTKLSFSNGLYFGAFRRKGKEIEKLEKVTTDYRYYIAVGHGIYLNNCSKVAISSLDIDGANRNYITGGQFGDVGFQIEGDGLFMKNCSSITLVNLSLHHFGRDGLQILNQTPQGFATPSQNIQLTNCRFEYNGRQGFSWTGGVGLKATNCSFSYTGQLKFNSPPGAGIDFEPNYGYIVKDAIFTNCVFKSNEGVGVLADVGGFNVKGVQFINCTLQGEKTAALWIKSPGFSFVDCKIFGTFYFGCAATTASEGTKFIHCDFSDELSQASKTNYLVESNGARFLLFDHCTFRSGSKGIMYMSPYANTEADRTKFKDCHFISKQASPVGPYTTNTDFTGNTLFENIGSVANSWNLDNSRFVGTKGLNNTVKVKSKYILASYRPVVLGGEKEPVTIIVEQDGALFINNNAQLYINETGTLLIKKGGSLWIAPGAELLIKGKIIAEDGAFICIHHQAKLSQTSLKKISMKGKPNFSDNPQMKYGLSGCITVPN